MSFVFDHGSTATDRDLSANVSVERGLCKVTKPVAVPGLGQLNVENVPPRY